jgi:hypothetical protein
MRKLSALQLDKFVSGINQDNFLVYTKLLNITDHKVFSLVVELLNDNRISLSMLSNLPIINDHTVNNFLNDYLLHLSPQILHSPVLSSFNAAAYLEGLQGGSNHSTLIDLVRAANAHSDASIGQDPRRLVRDFRVTTDRATGYGSLQDIKNIFKTQVLPAVHTALKTFHLGDIFVSPANLPVSAAGYEDEIRGWYESIMGPFLPALTTETLYTLLLSIDNDLSKAHENVVEFHELYNFRPFTENIPKLYNQTAFEVAALGRPYNDQEVEALESSIMTVGLLPVTLSDSFSMKLYRLKLLDLCKLYRGVDGYPNRVFDDLERISDIFEAFQKLVDAAVPRIGSAFRVVA